MTMKEFAQWLALLICVGSFVVYFHYSFAVVKYLGLYVALLTKLARLLTG